MSIRKTKETISEAVKEFLNENSCSLKDISITLASEKVFTDKKQYTVVFSKKYIPVYHTAILSDSEKEKIISTTSHLLSLLYFDKFEVSLFTEQNYIFLKIKTNGKDGLLIGKNGTNICALQYILSIIINKKLKKNIPLIIDVDSYYEKHLIYLKNNIKTIAEKVISEKSEYITELLPPNERKIIHEEIANFSLKSFSLGKGLYKKVVISSLL